MHTDVILTNKRRTHAQYNYTNTELKAWFGCVSYAIQPGNGVGLFYSLGQTWAILRWEPPMKCLKHTNPDLADPCSSLMLSGPERFLDKAVGITGTGLTGVSLKAVLG